MKRTDAWIHTRVNDGQCAHPVVFTTGCTELNVVSTVMMDSGFGQHSVVLNLRFPGKKKIYHESLILSSTPTKPSTRWQTTRMVIADGQRNIQTGKRHTPQSRTVVGQDYQLGFSLANHFLRLLVSENVFTALHHKLQSGVDGLQGLFL